MGDGDRESRETERNQQLARLSLDRSAEPVFWLGRNARFIYANDAACSAYGYSREELLSLSVFDVNPMLSRETWDEHWERMSRHRSHKVKSAHRRKDGTEFPVEVSVNVMGFEGEEYHCTFARDITDRKREEEESRFRAEFERLITTISARFINLETAEIDRELETAIREIGEYAEVDRCFLFLFSHDLSEMNCVAEWTAEGVPRHIEKLTGIATDQFPWWLEKLKRSEVVAVPTLGHLPESETALRDIFRLIGMRSVVDVPVFLRGSLVGFLGLASVTEEREWPESTITLLRAIAEIVANALDRRAMESALRESEAKLREVVEHAPIVLWALDGEGVFTFSEGRGLKSLGLEPGQVVGQSVFELYRENPKIVDDARRVLAGESIRSLTIVGDLAYEVHYAPLFDDEGNPNGAIGVGTDVTERRRSEEERRRLEVMLRQSQKMEAVGQLAGGVAHDFNNLLQAIRGYAALGRRLSEGKVRSYLDEILHASDRAGELVRQLLTFSRREALRYEVLSVNGVVTGVMKMLRRLIGEHLELEVHTASDIRTIEGDRGQLEQVLVNLCLNSRDAMGEGGRLRIETSTVRYTETDLAARPWAREGEFVRLSVSDTGCGITPEVRERMFEPFFTTKEMGQGTGLGLATVYAITERHDGFINVVSEPGEGATMEIHLPVRDVPIPALASGTDGDDAGGGSEMILLAEDDEQVADLGRTILLDAGYRVLLARDGEEALELFSRHADEIGLAVLDVVMPRIGGRAVFDEIASARPDIPVLFTSGYSGNTLDKDGLPSGAFEVLPKPFAPQDLLAKIGQMLGR